MAPIPLSSMQWDLVYSAMRPLAETDRSSFLVALADTLSGMPPPIGDGQLWRLIARTQRQFWKPPKEKPPEHGRRKVGSAIA